MNENNNEKVYRITEKDLELASGGKAQHWEEERQKPWGIVCPSCGKFIPNLITDLIINDRVRCPFCLSVIAIDK